MIDTLTVIHGGLHVLQPVMDHKTFAIVSFGLLIITTQGNKLLRKLTTGPLHTGDRL